MDDLFPPRYFNVYGLYASESGSRACSPSSSSRSSSIFRRITDTVLFTFIIRRDKGMDVRPVSQQLVQHRLEHLPKLAVSSTALH